MKNLLRLLALALALPAVLSAQASLQITGIVAGKTSVKPGESVVFTATINNVGSAAYPGGTANFTLSLSSNNANSINLGTVTGVSIPAIAAEESGEVKFSRTIPLATSEAANYFINVTTGGLTQVAPVTATATVTIAGGAITTTTVTNGGIGYSGAPTVTLPAVGGDVPAPVAALGAIVTNGAVTAITVTNAGGGYINGTRTLTLSAPTPTSASFSVSSFTTDADGFAIVGKPDLQITNLTFSTGTFAPLDVIPMTLSYTNRASSNGEPNVPYVPGNGTNGDYFRIQVIISTNAVYGDEDDFMLTFFDIAQRENADGATRTLSWNQLLPRNFPGTFFVLAKIDTLEAVDEVIEDDLAIQGQNIFGDRTGAKVTLTPANSPTIEIFSTSTANVVGDRSSERPALSVDGRYVAFYSAATNLVEGDTNNVADVFVKDTVNGFVTRVSKSANGVQGNGPSINPAISANGRFVAFQSAATNLVPGDTNNFADIFVFDTLLDQISRVNVGPGNVQANNASANPSLSSDGRYVVFESSATNLVGATTVGRNHVYLVDRQENTLVRVDQGIGGVEANGAGEKARLSPDGSTVVFVSAASNLVAGDTNNQPDIFAYDVATRAITRLSVSTGGVEANGPSLDPVASANGRYVAFSSRASNLVADDTNGVSDIFVRDRVAGTTLRVSVSAGGAQAIDPSVNPIGSVTPSISHDGRYVAYASLANNLVAGDTVGRIEGVDGNGAIDIFVLDRDRNANGTFDEPGDYTVVRASTNRFGYQTISVLGEQSSPASLQPAISGDGRYIAMASDAKGAVGLSHVITNLVSRDTNDARDIFIYDAKLDTLPQPGFNQAPNVTITAPSEGGTVTVNTDVTVTATASDSDGSVTSVAFFVNEEALGAAVTSPPYRVTWTPTATGTYTLSAIATDNKGLVGNAVDVSVIVTEPLPDGETPRAATVYRGTYLGVGDSGQFTVVVDRNGTGTFLAYSTEKPGSVFRINGISVGADGSFNVPGSNISGVVGATGVSGTFGGGTFIGTVTVATQSGQFTPALFDGGLTNLAGGSMLAVVGGDGSIFAMATSGSTQVAANGLIGTNGSFTLNAADGHRFTGTYTAATATIGGVLSGPKLNSGFILGQPKSRLLNLSSRAVAGTGDNVLIAGFRVFGSGSRELLIRGVGPTLANFGLTGTVANPNLTIFNAQGTPVAFDDNWTAAVTPASERVRAFPLVPGSLDAVVLTSLTAGNYTAVLGGGAGLGLIEIYDAGPPGDAGVSVTNLSTRGQVGVNERIMITGFVVGGEQSRRFLIRAVGPTLANFGLGANALANPAIKLFRESNVIRENDDWNIGETAALVANWSPRVGAFTLPPNSRDAALAVTLAPGNYTVQVSGVGATTGVVLVEIYDVDAVQ